VLRVELTASTSKLKIHEKEVAKSNQGILALKGKN
jgi:hypothetical protein